MSQVKAAVCISLTVQKQACPLTHVIAWDLTSDLKINGGRACGQQSVLYSILSDFQQSRHEDLPRSVRNLMSVRTVY